jgi:hypothetical protein
VITRLTDPTRGVTAGEGKVIRPAQLKTNILNERIVLLSSIKCKISRHIELIQ